MATTTIHRYAHTHRRRSSRRRGTFPCLVPENATAEFMALIASAYTPAQPTLSTGSCALDLDLPDLPEPAEPQHGHRERPPIERRAPAPTHSFWTDPIRREEVIGSDAFFLFTFFISWIASGAIAYLYALWTIGPY